MRTQRKTKNAILSLVLVFAMLASVAVGLVQNSQKVHAFDTESTLAYNPMSATKDPFKNAPTFTMAETATVGTTTDYWEFVQLTFDKATSFASTDYLAIEMRIDKGAFGLTIGVLENGDRYNTSTDNKNMYFVDSKTGNVTALSVLYSAINFSAGMEGILLMPIANLSWQWNNNSSSLKSVSQFYYTANPLYNRDYALTIGNIGVYRGDPSSEDTTYETLLDVYTSEKRSQYYVDSKNPDCLFMPSDAGKAPETAPEIAYPFTQRTGEEALVNAAHWSGPSVGDSSDNWQTLTVTFDSATVDMTKAEYLVIETYIKAGSPGLTYGLNSGNARYSATVDGVSVWGVKEGETAASKIATTQYGAATVGQGFKGAILLSMENMVWQFGSTNNKSLATISNLTITTNSRYNYAYEVVIGEIGYVDADGKYVSILDLEEENSNAKKGKYTIKSDNSENVGTLEYWTAARKTKGDSTIDFQVKNKAAESFDIWTGGSYGQVTIVKDSYGENAAQLMATGTSTTGGDAYTAITLAMTGGWSWAGMTGVSFWARNDSDTEVSFNLEIDCKDNNIGKSDRFNIKQGNRFYLYDINTGKTTIYMTRPCATLPVGFEGWVYIPFTAFSRADWSTNGVTVFMGENSMVSYLAITIHAATYKDKAFSVNNFGGYTKVPSFESYYVKSDNTISSLLGLN